jgi:hypothetical protein
MGCTSGGKEMNVNDCPYWKADKRKHHEDDMRHPNFERVKGSCLGCGNLKIEFMEGWECSKGWIIEIPFPDYEEMGKRIDRRKHGNYKRGRKK